MKRTYIFKTFLLLSFVSIHAQNVFIDGFSLVARNSAALVSGIAKGTGKLVLDASNIGAQASAYPRAAAAVVGLSSLGAYSLYCCYLNYMNQDVPGLITAARNYTQFLDTSSLAQAGKPSNFLMYWRNCPKSMQSHAFFAPADMTNIVNAPGIWNLLKQDWQSIIKDYTDASFKTKMLGQIESEKSELNRIRVLIDQKIENTPGKQLIMNELAQLRLDIHAGMRHLSKDNIKRISAMINAYYDWSYISLDHLKVLKNNLGSLYNKIFSSRFEGELVKQYWKLSILLARLEALEFVVNKN